MKISRKIFWGFIAAAILLFNACTKADEEADVSTAVPNVTVNVTINIATSTYASLKSIGGVAYIANVGNRGIMLYRLSTSTIIAMDRTCSYDLPDANGIVVALTNGTAMCPDCNSIYNLYDGSVNTGRTTIGLKIYSAAFNAGTGILTVTN